jgi:hypothetical protein
VLVRTVPSVTDSGGLIYESLVVVCIAIKTAVSRQTLAFLRITSVSSINNIFFYSETLLV